MSRLLMIVIALIPTWVLSALWASDEVGWLQILVFLLVYEILDARFGKEIICQECGHRFRRTRPRCPDCSARLHPARLNIVHVVVALSFFLLWIVSIDSGIWFYSGTRYYFFIGDGRMGLDYGIHYGLGAGFREYVPGFDYNVFHIYFRTQLPVIALVILFWNLKNLIDSVNPARPAFPRCPCGYNLTGNASGVCPECGRPVTTTSDQP